MASERSSTYGWLMIGFALGGFFDGILLHQILQWHHLLSGLDDPAASDLRFQIPMDRLFHLLMYLLALLGILLVLRRRQNGLRPDGWQIFRLSLLGFSTWHIIDAVLSHWLLGIHRIRMDSAQPIVWDVAWLIMFGILPLLIALRLPRLGGPASFAPSILVTALATGLMAGFGPALSNPNETIVVFRGSISEEAKMRAVLRAGADLRWSDPSGSIWGVSGISFASILNLYLDGAALVSTTPMVAGCLRWTPKS